MEFCNILQLINTWVKIQYLKFMLLESQVVLETLRTTGNPRDNRKPCKKLEESTKKHGSLGEFRKTTKDVPFCTFLSIFPKYARAKVFLELESSLLNGNKILERDVGRTASEVIILSSALRLTMGPH